MGSSESKEHALPKRLSSASTISPEIIPPRRLNRSATFGSLITPIRLNSSSDISVTLQPLKKLTNSVPSSTPQVIINIPNNILNNSVDVRIVRTEFTTPRNRAVLQVQIDPNRIEIDYTKKLYNITIRDRGLRTIEQIICDYETAMKHIYDWTQQYKCKIYKTYAIAEMRRCKSVPC